MATKKLNILHLDSEKSWRGGQQQAFYLHKELVKEGINSLFVSNKDAEILIRCKNDNLPFYEKSMFGELDIISAYKLSKLCRRNNITILHAHSAHSLSIGLFIKLFYPSLILIGVRRVDFSIGKNIFSRVKYNSKKINRIICISDFIRTVLIKDGISEDKLITIRSGVDINKFDKVFPSEKFRENLGVKPNEILIGTVAAFAGHKDYPNLLTAFAIVRKKLDNIKLCLVGDGPLKKEIEKIADQLGISKDVIFTNFVENVGEYLKAFNIFVLASRKEGLGTSLIDALSVGLPIIATNAGGIPELIKDDKNGILVEAKNNIKLAEAIINLINNPQKQKELSIAAKSSAQKFSIEETVRQNISEYKRLLSEKHI